MKKKEFAAYANSFQAIARQKLESISLLLEYMGNPEKNLKFIHIAGTNGKGSVSQYLQCILTDSGLKTGKYISPNMISVCERISIDGENISESEMESLLEEIRIYALKVKEVSGDAPTQFEIWTAAAFSYFNKQKCDIVVLETGLGGTQDATNVIPPPLVSVITHIALDHTQFLGDTLEKIAGEKAGIIKAHNNSEGLTVSAIQDSEAEAVLKKVCKERNNRFIVTKTPDSLSHSLDGEFFSYKGISPICSKMLGVHQLFNASLAIETALNLGIEEKYIISGTEKARNPGRFEIVSKKPLILFDGAHNSDGTLTLKDGLNRYFSDKSKTFIMGCMSDKDISASLEIIKTIPNIDEFFSVSVKDNPRAMPSKDLADVISSFGLKVTPQKSITEAILKSKSDMIVICGSLYLYKDYKESL